MSRLDKIRAEIARLSGSGKRVVSTRRHGLYSSFTLPGLTDMPAVRDTLQRFRDFGVPEDLTGKTVLDVGCNVGAMIFEAAHRGAVIQGLEYRQDRVNLCQEIADYYAMPATFFQDDFNDEEPGPVIHMAPTDYVLCCSVTQYIDELEAFYHWLSELLAPGGTLLLECNRQRDWSVSDTMNIMEVAGFRRVSYLGNGHSGGISRKRKLFSGRIYV